MTEKAVLVIRRRRLAGEAPNTRAGASPGSTILDGTFGTGRILQSLSELGLKFRTVIQSIHDADATAADLDGLDVGRLFVTVVLGSHLVNVSDEALRRAFLDAARRHLVGDCDVLVEHHPLDWATTAAAIRPVPGGSPGMTRVRRAPPFVSAVSVYDVGGQVVRQPFTARVLSDAELVAALDAAGLFVRGRLGPTWLVAGPVAPRAWSVEQPPHP